MAVVRLSNIDRLPALLPPFSRLVLALIVVAGLADRAQAQPAIHICSDLDTNLGGTPMDFSSGGLDLTVLPHDRITVTNSGGTARYHPPGGSVTDTASPAILDVGPGQGGNWLINVPVVAGTTIVGCTIGGAAHPKDEAHFEDRTGAVRALQSALDTVTPSLIEDLGLGFGGAPGTTGGAASVAFAPVAASPGTGLPAPPGASDLERAIVRFKDGASSGGGWEPGSFEFSADLTKLGTKGGGARQNGSVPGDALAYGGASSGYPENSSGMPLVSMSGRYIDFDDHQSAADRSGHLWLVTSSFGRRFTPSLAAGVVTRYREGSVRSNTIGARLETRNFGLGTYLAFIAPEGTRLTAAALYETGDNEVAFVGSTGAFDSETLTLEARVDRRYANGDIWIEPNARVLYVHTRNDGYTDSLGIPVTGFSETLGRVSFGPKVGANLRAQDGTAYRPFVKVEGVWDFTHADSLTSPTGTVLENADAGVGLGGGIEVEGRSGLVLDLEGEWFRHDTDLDGWSLSGGIGTPLSTLGFGTYLPGVAAFRLSSSGDDAHSAEARVDIPLGVGRSEPR